MKFIFSIKVFTLVLLIRMHVPAAPFETLNKIFNRTKSHVVVRKIDTPTLANLDCATYFANPVLYDPQKIKPKKPSKNIHIADCTFGGALISPCTSLAQTPLTESEKMRPLAWAPLQNRLWEITKTDLFGKLSTAISGEKWADTSVAAPYQEIVAAYLHGAGDSLSLWVKIEFKPWVKFLDGFTSENSDGFHEMYGKLNLSGLDKNILAKALDWITGDYIRTILTKEQVTDWANTLASYWYPKLNTDIVDMTGQTVWPTGETEKKIKHELKGLSVTDPTIVIRGNPYGDKIYNVYVVDFPKKASPPELLAPTVSATFSTPAHKDTTHSVDLSNNSTRFAEEIKIFGDYPIWAKKDEPFRQSLAALVKTLPQGQLGFKGRDGWLFFGKEIDYLNGGDLTNQPPDKNPLPCLKEFKALCDKNNIALLFCIVPNKSEIYYEKLPGDAPKEPNAIVNPWERKFLADLERTGIQTVDLLPAFLAAKQKDTICKEMLYQKHDTHWTLRGLTIAAQLISERIKLYPWYGECAKTGTSYTLKDTSCSRLGDIVERLPENERAAYPADSITAQQVYLPDGTLYKANNPDAPIMLIGDSFTGVFELVDCKGAGVGAHIAAATGVPVDIITSWGGGPLVRDKMVRARKIYFSKKKVIVYMMVARDLYNYSQNWLQLENH